MTICVEIKFQALHAIDAKPNSLVDFHTGDYDNRTALHLGAAEGHLAAVKYLVARGADVNAVDRWRGTPLRDAEAGEHTETVAFCVEINQ